GQVMERVRRVAQAIGHVPLGPGLLRRGEHRRQDQPEAEADAEADQHRRRRVAGHHALRPAVAVGHLLAGHLVALADVLPDLRGPFLDPVADVLDLLADSPVLRTTVLTTLALALVGIPVRHRLGSLCWDGREVSLIARPDEPS